MISLKYMFKRIIKKLTRTKHEKTVQQFKKEDGFYLRLNYELNENSIVLDCGGYTGQWASDLYSMHNCNILIFEPVKKFAASIEQRFKNNHKIKVFDFGLSNKNCDSEIYIDNNCSSTFKKNGKKEIIKLANTADFLINHNIKKIDLIKINIEGGEYDLLEHLIKIDFIKNISNLQIQFHDFAPNAINRTKKIREELKKTHHLTYQYDFVWENWTIHQ